MNTALAPRQELLKIPEAQRVLGEISRPFLYKLIDGGEITRVHLGRRAMITRSSLDAYLERLATPAKPQRRKAS